MRRAHGRKKFRYVVAKNSLNVENRRERDSSFIRVIILISRRIFALLILIYLSTALRLDFWKVTSERFTMAEQNLFRWYVLLRLLSLISSEPIYSLSFHRAHNQMDMMRRHSSFAIKAILRRDSLIWQRLKLMFEEFVWNLPGKTAQLMTEAVPLQPPFLLALIMLMTNNNKMFELSY